MNQEVLKQLTFWSLPLFILHGLEEYLAGYTGLANMVSTSAETFLLFEIMFWLALGVFIVSLTKWRYILFFTLGLLFIYEFIHLFWSLRSLNYKPGLITGVLLAVFGFFYWKELLQTDFSSHQSNN